MYKRPLRLCSLCNMMKVAAQKTNDGYVCCLCYRPPKKECDSCKEYKVIHKTENNIKLCRSCYKPPERKCDICGEVKQIKSKKNSINICISCYTYPQIPCSNCNIKRKVAEYIDGNPTCKKCYDRKRLKVEKHRITGLLRKRIRDCFKRFLNKKKIKTSDEYGINYKEIIDHLGPSPGEYYEIDHIFPLVAFDFNNPVHVKAAFDKLNHQWLKNSENRSKSAKYDKQAFLCYINKFTNLSGGN